MCTTITYPCCIECGDPIGPDQDIAEFDTKPGRYFHVDCIDNIGPGAAWLLARTAPESVYTLRAALSPEGAC